MHEHISMLSKLPCSFSGIVLQHECLSKGLLPIFEAYFCMSTFRWLFLLGLKLRKNLNRIYENTLHMWKDTSKRVISKMVLWLCIFFIISRYCHVISIKSFLYPCYWNHPYNYGKRVELVVNEFNVFVSYL